MFLDMVFANLFASYAAKAIRGDNIVATIIWCGLTIWLSYRVVKDYETG